MLLNDRQTEIVRMLRTRGVVTVEELVERFQVSAQTIRRDILCLRGEGLVRRFNGGALLPATARNIDYGERRDVNPVVKQMLAEMVAGYLPDGASVFMSLGTTIDAIAEALRSHVGLRIITNNINVVNELGANDGCEVVMASGAVRPTDLGVTGEETLSFLELFHADFAVLSVGAVEPDGTLRDFDYHDCRVAQTMMKQSREVLLVVDHSKFNRASLARVGHLREVHHLFTDRLAPPCIAKLGSELGVAIHSAAVLGLEPGP